MRGTTGSHDPGARGRVPGRRGGRRAHGRRASGTCCSTISMIAFCRDLFGLYGRGGGARRRALEIAQASTTHARCAYAPARRRDGNARAAADMADARDDRDRRRPASRGGHDQPNDICRTCWARRRSTRSAGQWTSPAARASIARPGWSAPFESAGAPASTLLQREAATRIGRPRRAGARHRRLEPGMRRPVRERRRMDIQAYFARIGHMTLGR